MGSSWCLQMFLILCCFKLNVLANSLSHPRLPLCHEDESLALLQFKHSFVINKSASFDPSAYPKDVESWKLDGNTSDCCSWDGVACDRNSGRVISLDLSSSYLYGSISSNSSLFNLVHLRKLNLADNDFNSSQIPKQIGSLSKLRSLDLSYSGFSGEFPTAVFHLPNLEILDISGNEDLTGYIPEFHQSSLLKFLGVGMTSFSGKLPSTIGNLKSLSTLLLNDCNFFGTIPASLGNLTELSMLHIDSNKLVGQIPSWIGNLTRLLSLQLQYNQLQGMIPSSIFRLENLEELDLGGNNLSGKVELDRFFYKLPRLSRFSLGDNNLTAVATNNTNGTLPKLNDIGLISCNLREFPYFLRFQYDLEQLYIADNLIHGQIPTWLWNTTKESLKVVDLSANFLTGFEQSPDVFPWKSLQYLELSENRLQGSLPVPPPPIVDYRVTSNLLAGEISPSICHKSYLSVLDLSRNNLNGSIPQCLTNSSEALSVLDLSFNNFHGIIPQMFMTGIKLIDLSENQLHGQVPPSLANCTMLQTLVLGNNHIEGTFPYWLGALPDLQVLILRSNEFHGAIENLETNLTFSKLRIIDLSHNGFSGKLPSNYFKNWNAMKLVKLGKLTYMNANVSLANVSFGMLQFDYMYTMTIAQKGTLRLYERIQSAFVAIDLSNNKFSGEIPESLGSLSGVHVLNISNNNLTGAIPSSLASLTELESLDLSQNELSGKIPQQLIQLTFLEVLDVSHNHLTGRIPRGKQFDTFDNSSYDGNPGLCGVPLSTSCENFEASPPPPPRHSPQGDETEFPRGIYWMVIFMGYGSGLIVGLVLGTTLTRRYHEWFVDTFGRRKKIQKKQKRNDRRN